MDTDMVRRITDLERQIDRLKTLESGPTPGQAISEFLSLPGLIGFWPMNSISASLAYDRSGQSRNLTLNGSPTSFVLSNGIQYVDLDGSTQYLSRANESDLDVTSSLTVGGWFRMDVSANQGMISRWQTTGSQRSWLLTNQAGSLQFIVSQTGAASTATATSSKTYTTAGGAGAWSFWAGRYTPSSEVTIFINDTKDTTTSGVPSAIFAANATFLIGAYSGIANLLNGAAALCFYCASAISDASLSRLFNKSRQFFGV